MLFRSNLFEVAGGFVMPVTFGGDATAVTAILRGLPVKDGTKKLLVEAIYPGEKNWMDLGAVEVEPEMRITVPLQRKCAMIRLTP